MPSRETRNRARTSASPSVSSVSTGREHADERLLDVLGELVDDAVRADVDALALGERARIRARADVEADHERVRRGREVDVVLGDPADARVDDVHAHFRVLDLLELADERLDGALDVALEDDVQVLNLAGLKCLVERLERDPLGAGAGELLTTESLGADVREVLCLALVLDDAGRTRRRRRMVEPEHLHRLARPGLLDLLAAVVVERAHLAGCVSGHGGVADAERPSVNEDG